MSAEGQNQYDDEDLITELSDEELEVESGGDDDFDSEPEQTYAEQKPDKKPRSIRKRINQLTYRAKLAEEQAQAALRADEENKRLIAEQAAKLAEFESRFAVADSSAIDTQIVSIKKQQQQAFEDGDYEKFSQLDEQLYSLRRKKETSGERKQESNQQQTEQPVQNRQPVQQQQKLQSQLDYEAENSDWIMPDGENYDPEKVERANKIAARLFQNGVKPDSPKFWKLVDANLNKQRRAIPSGETGGYSGSAGKSGGKLTNAEKQTLRNWGGNPDNPADVAEFLKYRKG